MNHWLQKKKDREIAECYADYDRWEQLAVIYNGKEWKKIAEGYCSPPKHTK